MSNRNKIFFVCLSISLIFFFLLDVFVGQIDLDLTNSLHRQVLFSLRLPKAITAVIAGIGLSLSGLMMQTLFRNPLAGPYILGVSSGATLGVAAVLMVGAALGIVGMSNWLSIMAAIIGSTLVLLLVLAISHKIRHSVSLLIVGMMIGSMASAVVNIIQNYANPDALKLFIVWTFGSLSAVTWQQLEILVPIFFVGCVIAVCLIKPLNGLLMGENQGRALGVDVKKTRLLIILSTGLLAGGITAFTGPIAFIGIAVPHIARGLFRSTTHNVIMPATMLIGATLLLVCDMLSGLTTYPLPISTVTALFGAPIVIWIIVKKK
ncbi:MAG: iron ABC transporter permease [Paludibacteraceae bacterium]|nr:iron ABC transporter permease [Paludibacteraceae bacterium]